MQLCNRRQTDVHQTADQSKFVGRFLGIEEDDYPLVIILVGVPLQAVKSSRQTLIFISYGDESLFNISSRFGVLARVDSVARHRDGLAEGELRQFLSLRRERGREEERLTVLGALLQNGHTLLFKAELDQPIGFIEDYNVQQVEMDIGAIQKQIKAAPRRCNDDIWLTSHLCFLLFATRSTSEQASGDRGVLAERLQCPKSLFRQLTSREKQQNFSGSTIDSTLYFTGGSIDPSTTNRW